MKKDLIPMKHLLISRDRQVYWYIGDSTNPQYNVIACGTAVDRDLDNTWDENLIAIRHDSMLGYEEPRKLDIIYIYEITNFNLWLEIFHKEPYIKFNVHINVPFAFYPFVKQIYERIDNELEELDS